MGVRGEACGAKAVGGCAVTYHLLARADGQEDGRALLVYVLVPVACAETVEDLSVDGQVQIPPSSHDHSHAGSGCGQRRNRASPSSWSPCPSRSTGR
jgi:hypothetical protein